MNILLTSHSTLCKGLVEAYQMLDSSGQLCLSAVPLTHDGVSDYRIRLNKKFSELHAQGNVLILADLPGGTPYNEANMIFQVHQDSVRLIAGVNFPMLIELGCYVQENDDLDEAVRIACAAGHAGIVEARSLDNTTKNYDDDLF